MIERKKNYDREKEEIFKNYMSKIRFKALMIEKFRFLFFC